jgi:catechol 2,3-dioxygenase-like lactoylglutathione lyase family enzyme
MTTSTNLVHVSLDTADLERSIAFYTRLFAAPPVRRETDYAKFEPADVPIVLSLNPAPAAAIGPQRLSHLGVRVADATALGTLRERLARAGLAAREERDAVCCYARADKLWVADPDGNDWELYLRLGDAPVRYPETAACCAPTEDAPVACCSPR